MDFNVSKVVGCLVSHVHGDHFGYVSQYKPFMHIYTSAGTIKAAGMENDGNVTALQEKVQYKLGNFTVMPFLVEHDAPEPYGYLIKHHDFGLLMFATDTYYLRYRFKGLNYVMLECNYDKEYLDGNVRAGVIPVKVRERVIRSHMSCADCIKTLRANDLSQVRAIILLHLSGNNGNMERFVERVKDATGKPTLFARKGLQMEMV